MPSSFRSVRALAAGAGLLLIVACSGEDTPTGPTGPTTLQITDVVVGTGATAVSGDVVTVHYVGAFLDGREFDSSVSRGQPITFQTGTNAVVPGFEQGILGMKIGGRRLVVIPSSLAYGAAGRPPTIPPNTPLQFGIELLAIQGK